jgi:hypothetical protein
MQTIRFDNLPKLLLKSQVKKRIHIKSKDDITYQYLVEFIGSQTIREIEGRQKSAERYRLSLQEPCAVCLEYGEIPYWKCAHPLCNFCYQKMVKHSNHICCPICRQKLVKVFYINKFAIITMVKNYFAIIYIPKKITLNYSVHQIDQEFIEVLRDILDQNYYIVVQNNTLVQKLHDLVKKMDLILKIIKINKIEK